MEGMKEENIEQHDIDEKPWILKKSVD